MTSRQVSDVASEPSDVVCELSDVVCELSLDPPEVSDDVKTTSDDTTRARNRVIDGIQRHRRRCHSRSMTTIRASMPSATPPPLSCDTSERCLDTSATTEDAAATRLDRSATSIDTSEVFYIRAEGRGDGNLPSASPHVSRTIAPTTSAHTAAEFCEASAGSADVTETSACIGDLLQLSHARQA